MSRQRSDPHEVPTQEPGPLFRPPRLRELSGTTDQPSSAFRWRLKLGRRTGPLKRADLIHPTDGPDGLALWWPGPGKVEFS